MATGGVGALVQIEPEVAETELDETIDKEIGVRVVVKEVGVGAVDKGIGLGAGV